MNDPLAELLARASREGDPQPGDQITAADLLGDAAWLRAHRDELLTALGGTEHLWHRDVAAALLAAPEGIWRDDAPRSAWVFGEVS